mgnify:CR=1 FL=1
MKKQKPVHVGIIPDGNRRWAVAHGLSKADGYHYGLEPGLRLLQQAKVYGIQELTYYGFTVDNCKRPYDQFAAFQKACVEAVQFLTTEGVDLLVIGNTESKCFPEELKKYNTDLCKWWRNQIEFSRELRMEVGFISYIAGWTAIFFGHIKNRYDCEMGRDAAFIRFPSDSVCVCRFLCGR